MGAMSELDIERKNTVNTLHSQVLNLMIEQQVILSETIQDKLIEAYNAGLEQALNYTPFEELFEKLPQRIEGWNKHGLQSAQNIGFALQRANGNYQCYAVDIDEPEYRVYRLHSDRIQLRFIAITAKDAVQLMLNYLTENNLIQK